MAMAEAQNHPGKRNQIGKILIPEQGPGRQEVLTIREHKYTGCYNLCCGCAYV